MREHRLFSLRRLLSTVLSTVVLVNVLFPFVALAQGAPPPALPDGNIPRLQPLQPIAAPQIATGQLPPPGLVKDYYLGPGDRLSIMDYSSSDTDQPVSSYSLILPDGTANIHPIGVFRAAGLTLAQLNALVIERARALIKEPDIVITVSRTREVPVYVFGEVVYPGLYEPGLILPGRGTGAGGTASPDSGSLEELGAASARFGTETMTVTAILQLAGGLKETANVRDIRVTRKQTGEVLTVDLWKLLTQGDVRQDLVLQPGDVIYVPKGGTDTLADAEELGLAVNYRPRVRVWGGVRNPGLYDLHSEDDVLSIIARAGGFTDAAKKKAVLLARVSKSGQVVTEAVNVPQSVVEATASGRSKVRSGDVVVVAESPVRKHAGKVIQFGATFVAAAALLFINGAIQKGIVREAEQLNPATFNLNPINVPRVPGTVVP